MKIAVRLDDITPDMDWDKFLRFKALMDEAYVLPLIGVVPDCRDPKLAKNPPRADFWDEVRRMQENGWTIAMHGCHHVYTTKKGGLFPLNAQSEFAGLSYEDQLRLIREGKRILEDHGIVTDLFMAPAHSYDRNTLRALTQSGFSRMTDGFGRAPYLYRGITFYPISADRGAVLRHPEKEGVTTFVVHTNTLSEEGFAYYKEVFARQNMLPYRELLYYQAKKQGALGRFREYSMALAKRTLMAARNRK
ncbi:MAG: DUF2334 domain-containing protein [Firmicutes bacterium]|nr:DUF2334 domain-containing protein [Bacillota bacterium]